MRGRPAITVPGAIYELQTFHDSERTGAAPYWFTPGEHAALAYLDRLKAPGAVLARQYLGMAVPAFTGRPVQSAVEASSVHEAVEKARA